MRLLDRIVELDEQTICCAVTSHSSPDHPMRFADRLGSACGVEMAAQAVALHCAHRAMQASDQQSQAPKGGMLTAVRELKLHTDRLDTIAQPLTVRANFHAGDAMGALYSFSLSTQESEHAIELLSGRMSVVNFVR
jgi:predicted hotdog family 3-hydroxylacyl-ACP dehydratase